MASNGGAAERRRQIVRGPDQRQTDKPEQSHPRAEARCRRQDRVQERREARTRGHQGRQLVSDTRVVSYAITLLSPTSSYANGVLSSHLAVERQNKERFATRPP